ncbi:MAG: peptide chain release factor-like protein [Deltaproteobacteria bacterium]|nr:peptide chain release factor-like protein [Deltaproteobacteria bacterium]
MPTQSSINIKKSDIEIEFYRSSGPGGQHKNKTATAVRIRHIPTGIVVQASERRSQHMNREVAMERLEKAISRLYFKPKKRIPTKLSRSQKTRRLEDKKKIAGKKVLRKVKEED